ncbi:MAG: hypothetical protein C6H99_03660 [Epsilonproteobacteria bacterium]|nr:hypothetical protein [Campylobacterota bacterium]NPA64570.1 EI24 domain-containing protein [Campylobacterota bacterium]
MQKSIFTAALEDFLTKKFLTLTFAPFFLTLLLFSWLFWGAGGELLDILSQLAQDPNAIQDPAIANFVQEHPWIATIASSAIFKILFGTILALLGTLLAILLSTATATIIMGFFTPTVVREIHRRHYSHIPIEGGIGALEYLWLALKIILKSIGLFLLAIILYFIPLLNALAINIPFYYLFHSFLSLDVGGEIYRAKELETILKRYRTKVMGTTAILYLITLIPFAGMILQVYFVSVMAHLFFRIKADQ